MRWAKDSFPEVKVPLWKADLILLFCTLLWGGTFVGVKVCLEYIPPFFLVFLRFGLSTLLFLVLFYKEICQTEFREVYRGMLLGFFVLAGFGFQTLGLRHISVSRSAFLTEALVIFVPFLQIFILGRPLMKSTLLGVLTVFAGITLLTTPQIGLGEFSLKQGDGWTLLCALAFSFFIVFIDRFKTQKMRSLIFFQSLGAALGSLAIVFFSGEWANLNISVHSASFSSISSIQLFDKIELLIWIFYLAFFASGLAIFLQIRYQPLTSPARAGVIFGSEPVLASFLAFVILGEAMEQNEIAGAALVIIGVLAMELIPLGFKLRSPQSPAARSDP